MVTLRTIRRENLLRAVGRAFTLPISTIARNRSLIRTMVRRDILGRYRGSFGGVFWTILNPLLLMLTYFFVFGVVLRTRFGVGPQPRRLRALFPGGNAALAGLQRGGRTRAQRDAGASQLRQEAGLRGGNAARQPGGVGPGDARSSRCCSSLLGVFLARGSGARFGGVAARC